VTSLTSVPHTIEAIDWESWNPVDRGTLLFVVRDGQILLIHKKRGLGAGKINGPGGRIDHDETPLQCALRELHEEVQVVAEGSREAGELLFQFLDGYSIHVWVFRADDCQGTPAETDEALPFWVGIDEIPYSEMWQDDEIWLPLMLREQWFRGHFIFDGESLLDYQILDGKGTRILDQDDEIRRKVRTDHE
jgi:8-oxo-dGTP diphosphatase